MAGFWWGAVAVRGARRSPASAEEQVFDAMLAGWRDQQASCNLHADTIKDRLLAVRLPAVHQ